VRPAGKTVEWDSVIVDDIPDELTSWQSDAGARRHQKWPDGLQHAPGERGTLVTATIATIHPAALSAS
jgi:uncharacterized membrane protein